MKVKLFYCNYEGYEGLYTESELEDLKQELLENYRDDDYVYLREISDETDYITLTKAALGDEESQKEIEKIAENSEKQYWEDIKTDYIDEYEKEI